LASPDPKRAPRSPPAQHGTSPRRAPNTAGANPGASAPAAKRQRRRALSAGALLTEPAAPTDRPGNAADDAARVARLQAELDAQRRTSEALLLQLQTQVGVNLQMQLSMQLQARAAMVAQAHAAQAHAAQAAAQAQAQAAAQAAAQAGAQAPSRSPLDSLVLAVEAVTSSEGSSGPEE